jgi:hypothetical protein
MGTGVGLSSSLPERRFKGVKGSLGWASPFWPFYKYIEHLQIDRASFDSPKMIRVSFQE